MTLMSPLTGFADAIRSANRFSHLFALSDRALAARGLTRAGIMQDYLAAYERAEDRPARDSYLPSLGGFAQSG